MKELFWSCSLLLGTVSLLHTGCSVMVCSQGTNASLAGSCFFLVKFVAKKALYNYPRRLMCAALPLAWLSYRQVCVLVCSQPQEIELERPDLQTLILLGSSQGFNLALLFPELLPSHLTLPSVLSSQTPFSVLCVNEVMEIYCAAENILTSLGWHCCLLPPSSQTAVCVQECQCPLFSPSVTQLPGWATAPGKSMAHSRASHN